MRITRRTPYLFFVEDRQKCRWEVARRRAVRRGVRTRFMSDGGKANEEVIWRKTWTSMDREAMGRPRSREAEYDTV